MHKSLRCKLSATLISGHVTETISHDYFLLLFVTKSIKVHYYHYTLEAREK